MVGREEVIQRGTDYWGSALGGLARNEYAKQISQQADTVTVSLSILAEGNPGDVA